jgi:hypothetical protein
MTTTKTFKNCKNSDIFSNRENDTKRLPGTGTELGLFFADVNGTVTVPGTYRILLLPVDCINCHNFLVHIFLMLP